jgi:hypothetical protein
MEIYELHQGELFLIETIRYFKFLEDKGFECFGFSIYGREHYVMYKNKKNSKEVHVILEQGLDVIFENRRFWGKQIISLKEIASLKQPISSVKYLSELVKSKYMYLIYNAPKS